MVNDVNLFLVTGHWSDSSKNRFYWRHKMKMIFLLFSCGLLIFEQRGLYACDKPGIREGGFFIKSGYRLGMVHCNVRV
jgi:hypothetical protein